MQDYCTICFLLLIKKSIILHLCSSKIAWDNYASLQMISEYFPARDGPLNRVKTGTAEPGGRGGGAGGI